MKLSKDEWIARYGGQELLDAEGFDVVRCRDCPLCDLGTEVENHSWDSTTEFAYWCCRCEMPFNIAALAAVDARGKDGK